MQKGIWQDEHLKSYKNSFADVEKSVMFEFVGVQSALGLIEEGEEKAFLKDQVLDMNRYFVLSNLMADTKEITLYSIYPQLAIKAMEEFGMNGKVLFDAQLLLTGKNFDALFKGKTNIKGAYFIDDILKYSQTQLSAISDALAKQQAEVYINFYRTLNEAGTLDNIFKKSPAKVLEDFGFLDRKIHLVGCNFLDKDDALILAQYNVDIISTPLADMMLGRGAINLQSILASGLSVHLGSGEYPYPDMLQEGKIALGNTANLMYDPFALTKQQIEDMVVSNLDVDEMLTEVRYEKLKNKIKEIFRSKKWK